MRQQGGGEARAGADFQHLVGFADRQVLHQAGLHARGQHDLAGLAAQGNLHVHKSQSLVGRRHKVFAAHHAQQFQHLRVQHFPGADLLFDHVEAGLVQIHCVLHGVC